MASANRELGQRQSAAPDARGRTAGGGEPESDDRPDHEKAAETHAGEPKAVTEALVPPRDRSQREQNHAGHERHSEHPEIHARIVPRI